MKRKTASVLCVCLVALLAAGCGGQEAAEEAATSITVAQAARGGVASYLTYTGTVNPQASVAVVPKVSGNVTGVRVKLGDTVNRGDVLYTIDDTDLRLQVRQAEAGLASAQAAYNNAVGGGAQQSITQLEQALTAAELEYSNAQSAYERAKAANESGSAVKQAQATLDEAKGAYERAQASYDSNTAVAAAQVAYDSAKLAFERLQQLYEQGGVSKQQLEAAENQLTTAQAQLSSAQDGAKQTLDSAKSRYDIAQEQYNTAVLNKDAELESAKSRLDNAQASLNAARENLDLTQNVINPQNAQSASASVQSAQAALDIAREQLSNAIVTAPISGQVSAIPVEVGAMASQSSPVLLVDMDGVEIDIQVAEKNISSVSVGMAAKVSVTSGGIEQADAAVAEVSPAADAQTGMYDVKIYIENPDERFKAGMFADVQLVSGSHTDVLTIPTAAVKKDGGRTYVFVVNGDKLEERDIVQGIEQEDVTEVASGLSDGETVVVRGKDFVTAESKFKIVEE